MPGHRDNYMIKSLIGFSLLAWSVICLVYVVIELANKTNWFLMSLIPAAFFVISLVLLQAAAVHKVKADITRHKERKPVRSVED